MATCDVPLWHTSISSSSIANYQPHGHPTNLMFAIRIFVTKASFLGFFSSFSRDYVSSHHLSWMPMSRSPSGNNPYNQNFILKREHPQNHTKIHRLVDYIRIIFLGLFSPFLGCSHHILETKKAAHLTSPSRR